MLTSRFTKHIYDHTPEKVNVFVGNPHPLQRTTSGIRVRTNIRAGLGELSQVLVALAEKISQEELDELPKMKI